MDTHSPTREGLTAGLIGAGSVAAWFFFVDLFAGRPLFTPAVLGAAVFDLIGGGFGGHGFATHVAVYTVLHCAAFVVAGLVLSAVINLLDRRPSMLYTCIGVFVAFEIGFYTFTALLSRSPVFGAIAWYQFGAANLIASYLMIRYLWHAHHETAGDRWLRAMNNRVESQAARD
jgi:hypothetical protein